MLVPKCVTRTEITLFEINVCCDLLWIVIILNNHLSQHQSYQNTAELVYIIGNIIKFILKSNEKWKNCYLVYWPSFPTVSLLIIPFLKIDKRRTEIIITTMSLKTPKKHSTTVWEKKFSPVSTAANHSGLWQPNSVSIQFHLWLI